jgi:hypothetical protein
VVGEQAPCECEGIRKRWAWFDKRYVAGSRGVSPYCSANISPLPQTERKCRETIEEAILWSLPHCY